MLVLAYLFGLFWLSLMMVAPSPMPNFEELPAHQKEWCAHNNNNAEPKFLVYNAIPKSGTTSLSSAVRNTGVFQVLSLDRQFYHRDLDSNVILKANLNKVLLEMLKNNTSSNSSFFMHGHLHHFQFNPAVFPGVSIDHVTILRECPAWSLSLLAWYNFAHLKPASPKAIQLKGTNIRKACMSNIKCLKNSEFTQFIKELRTSFLCGDNCKQQHKSDRYAGAMSNVLGGWGSGAGEDGARSGFSLVGLVERFNDTAEVLQCMYPNLLSPNLVFSDNKML